MQCSVSSDVRLSHSGSKHLHGRAGWHIASAGAVSAAMPSKKISEKAAARIQDGAIELTLQRNIESVVKYMTANPDKAQHRISHFRF